MSTWFVAAGESVQDAVLAAATGDRIEIAAGAFPEGLRIEGKALTLSGAGAAATTIGGAEVTTCLDTGGADLVVEGLSFAACEVLLVAEGGSLDFTDVELWGGRDAGSAADLTWTWVGGALDYLDQSGLVVTGGAVSWVDLSMRGNETEDSVVVLSAVPAATIVGLEGADNVVSGRRGGVLVVEDGTALALSGSTFTDDTLAGDSGVVLVEDGSLTTDTCAFERAEPAAVQLWGGDWVSVDDAFDGDGRHPAIGSDGPVSLTRPRFTHYDDVDYANIPEGVVVDLVADGGTFYFRGESIDGCTLASQGAALNLWGTVVNDCVLTGTGGAAVEGNVTLIDATVTGYAYAVTNGYLVAERSSFTDMGSLVAGNDLTVTLTDVSIESSGTTIEGRGLDLTLTRVDVISAGHGLAFSGVATLQDVVLDTAGSTIVMQGGTLSAESSTFTSDIDAVSFEGERGGRAAATLGDVVVESGGTAFAGSSDVSVDLALTGADLTAASGGVVLESGAVTLRDTRLDAGSVGIDVSGGVDATDVELTAGADAVRGGAVSLSTARVEAGGEGLVAFGGALSAEDVSVFPGGGCLDAPHGSTLTSVRCTGGAGVRPVDAAGAVVWYDVVVEGFSSDSPTKIADAAGTLSRVRFIDNLTSEGPGALTLTRSEIVAERLYFEGNRGVTVGALWANDTELAVIASVFRDNAPGALLEESGGDWACSAFTDAVVVAEESTTLRHMTATAGLELAGAFASVDSSIVTSPETAIYGTEGARTALFVYTDVWGAPAYAEGLADLTGQNGNLSADPLLDEALRLGLGSPALGAGNPAHAGEDGSPPDMGARATVCPELDFDGDGQLPSEGDCDDGERGLYSGAEEIPCDGLDNDCAGDGDDPDCDDPEDTGGDSGTGADSGTDTNSGADSGAPTDTDVEPISADDGGGACGCGGGAAWLLALGALGRRRGARR